jgi:hypothetical protein
VLKSGWHFYRKGRGVERDSAILFFFGGGSRILGNSACESSNASLFFSFLGDKRTVLECHMDIWRLDGNARADAVKRVVDLLRASRVSSGDGDALPKAPTPKHAKLALALAQGSSIEEASAMSGLSSRSCERYRYSPALRLVVVDLQRQHYDAEIDESSERIARAVPDAIATLISASNAGNITAAREILRLSDRDINDSSKDEQDNVHPFLTLMTPDTATPPLHQHDNSMTPPATSGKAEERPSPSPDPEYLRSIEPMWTTQPLKENEDTPLHSE